MPNLNLKNFAKIKDSNFDIQDITVFAGKPGSGKSYIMKILYALDESFRLSVDSYSDMQKQVLNGTELIEKMKTDFDGKYDEKTIKKIITSIKETLSKEEFKDYIPEKNNISTVFNTIILNLLKAIFSNIEEISSNFQIVYNTISLDYNNLILDADIDANNEILSKNAVFVETPLILEFIKFMDKTEGKTPYHIDSLMRILKTDYSFTDKEQDKFINEFRQKSQEIIKGDIHSDGDSFSFKTENKSFDIINASSGIKSLGLLQYLVTNKALKKGSTLFWEEPEVHLHPTWQLKMIDLFIELMNAGVKIIFSTHSPFMTDYLNAKATREKFGERVSFNLLSEEEGVVSNTILNDDNWNLLQSELLDPLEEIMWEYL